MAPNQLQLQNLGLNYNPTDYAASVQSMLQSQFGNISLGSDINLGYALAGIQDIENMGSDNPQQQASAMQGLISKAMDIISKLGNGETAAASAEASKNAKAASDVKVDAETLKTEFNAESQRISEQIDQQSEAVNNAKTDLEAVQKELEAEQEKIKETQEKINELQQALAVATDPEQQKEILGELQGYTTLLLASAANIATMNEAVAQLSKTVADSYSVMESSIGDAEALQSEGEQALQQLSEKAGESAKNDALSKAKGTGNEAVAKTLEAEAAATSSNIFTGATLAPQLYRAAADQEGAGAIRITSSAANLSTLLQGILGINDNVELLTSFCSSIGSSVNQYTGYIGDWNNVLNPMITSFGTLIDGDNNVKAVAEKLDTTVKSDINRVDSKDVKNEEADSNRIVNVVQQNKQNWNNVNEREQLNDLDTPKIKVQFGL